MMMVNWVLLFRQEEKELKSLAGRRCLLLLPLLLQQQLVHPLLRLYSFYFRPRTRSLPHYNRNLLLLGQSLHHLCQNHFLFSLLG